MKAKPRVLIIYTGGTIGMIKDRETGELANVDFNLISDHVPEIKRLNIEIESVSFEEPIDSSEIGIKHWKLIAKTLFEKYHHYDGFVVLHGSDTMAYTASALSFMLDGLQKPVILTGSQLPIGIIRTDGKENLITALEIAAEKNENGLPMVREVAVYFDYKLFRGNRCTKDSADNFEAFRSPNCQELAEAGVHLNYFQDRLYVSEKNNFEIKTDLNNRVALIKLFPGMDFEPYVALMDKTTVDGLVIETFGAGNSPTNSVFFDALETFIQSGGVVLNITQCNSGKVEQGKYQTSSFFSKIGVLSGGDMTTEAAVTKMMVFIDNLNLENSKIRLTSNLRGEVTY